MRIRTVAIGAVVLLFLAGCGRDDSTGSSGSSGGASTDMSQPLEGRALSKSSQLEGTWVYVTDGDYIGFEFTKDGNVLVTHALNALAGPGSGTMMTYSLMDGGRLALTAPTGQTRVFEATVSGDDMELKGGQLLSGGGAQRFHRLESGQTIAQVLQEREQAEAEAFQKRVAAVEAFLRQPNLVLVYSGSGPSAPASIGLDIQFSGTNFNGRAWHDERPPHLNAISGRLLLDENDKEARLYVSFGQRISPPAAQPDGGGQITMGIEGDNPADLRFSSQVKFGGSGPTYEAVLRSEPELHRQIVQRYEAELARIESLKQPLIETLKDYAVLQGRMQPQDARQTEPDTADLVLIRDLASGTYHCEGTASAPGYGGGQQATNGTAEITVSNNRPLLHILCRPTREYWLGLAGPDGRRLAGQWQPPNYRQGKGATFEIVEALDAAARDRKFETQRQALQALGPDATFAGLVFDNSGFGMQMLTPFRLEIAVGANGQVTGTGRYPALATVMAVAGRIADTARGPRLVLNYAGAESTPQDQVFFRSIQSGSWSLALAEGDGPARLTGTFKASALRDATLTEVTDDLLTQQRRRLVETLGEGGQLYLSRYVGWQRSNVPPTVVEWRLDEASDTITGTAVTGGQSLGANETDTTYEGQVRQDDSWLVLDVIQTTMRRDIGYPWALKLVVVEDADGVLRFSGAGAQMQPGATTMPDWASLDRRFELVPVASTDEATRAQIDEAIAASEAKARAALEVRREKMMPYFPLFGAATGAVITTDVPPEMGGVILDTEVDQENATITGRGIDLGEMPFREFTFECDLDNRGFLTVQTSLAETSYLFTGVTETGASGRNLTLAVLSADDRARLDERIALGKRLRSAEPQVLTVTTLDGDAAKAREATMQAESLPGVAIYRQRNNDRVAQMFTVESNRRYRWSKEAVTLRLDDPASGKALYIKGGPADDLTVIINSVHRASIGQIGQMGAAVVALPPDLRILEIRLEAGGTAQSRGVVLVK